MEKLILFIQMHINIFLHEFWYDPVYTVRRQGLIFRVVRKFWVAEKLSNLTVHSLLQSASCPAFFPCCPVLLKYFDITLGQLMRFRNTLKNLSQNFLNEIMRLVRNFERPPDEKSCEKVSQIEPNGFQLYCKKKD